MNALPATSETAYLTGQAALNVPTDSGDFADWHFTEVFLSGRGRFSIAGQNFIDTRSLLGNYGIRECSDALRKHGLVLGTSQKVYAANYVRAILDLVVSNILQGHIPHHITVSDTLDSEADNAELEKQIVALKHKMTDSNTLSLLEQWHYQQR
jgi:hypothetical protein